MAVRISLALVAMLWGCGSGPAGPDSEELSRVLSISNLSKQPIQDTADPSRIVGLTIEVDVINRGALPIVVPFTLTWSLRDRQGQVLGSASRRLEGILEPGASRHVSLTLNFPATPSLEEFQDVVTFDLVAP